MTRWLIARRGRTLLLLLLAANVFVWFRPGLPIGFSDGGLQTMLYHPLVLLRSAVFPWTDAELGGIPTSANVSLVPIYLFGALLRTMDCPSWLVQALFWYFIEATGMLAIRGWLRLLLRHHPHADIVATVGAIFYAFNMMTGLTFWFWDKLNITTIACVPLLLLAIEWSLSSSFWRGTSAMAVAVFLSASLFINGALVGPIAGLCGIYWVVRVLQQGGRARHQSRIVARTAAAGGLALAANAWILIPFFTTIGSYYSSALAQINGAAALQNATNWATWTGLVQFLPFGAASGGAWLYKNPSWRSVYSTPIFWGLALLIIVVMVVGTVGKCSRSKRLLLAGIAIIGVLLQAGAKGPLGQLTAFVVLHLPLGQVLRTPWRAIAPITLVGGSGLFGLGAVEAAQWFSSKRWVQHACMGVLIGAACGVYAFPLWTGQIVNGPVTQRGGKISSYVSIPPSYRVVGRYLKSHLHGGRVLALPLSPTSYVTMSLASGYDGSDQRWLLLSGVPTISFTASEATREMTLLSSYIDQSSPVDFRKLLWAAGALSCRYIVVDSAVTSRRGAYYNQILHTPAYYLVGLERQGLRPMLKAGTLTVFQVPSADVTPIAYGFRVGSPTDITTGRRPATQQSPTSWSLPVNRGGRWIVVLGETGAPTWNAFATIGGRTVQGHRVQVDGWANGWTFELPHLTTPTVIHIRYGTGGGYGFPALLSLVAEMVLLGGLVVPAISARRGRLRQHHRMGRNARRVPWRLLAGAALGTGAAAVLLSVLAAPDLFSVGPNGSDRSPMHGPQIYPISLSGGNLQPTTAAAVAHELGGDVIMLSGLGGQLGSHIPSFVPTPAVRSWDVGRNAVTITVRVPAGKDYRLVFSGGRSPVTLAAAEHADGILSSLRPIVGSPDDELTLAIPATPVLPSAPLGPGITKTLGNCTASAGGRVGSTMTATVDGYHSSGPVLSLRSSRGTACVHVAVKARPVSDTLLWSFSSKATASGPSACAWARAEHTCLVRATSQNPGHWVRQSFLLARAAPVSSLYFYGMASGHPNLVRFKNLLLESIHWPSHLIGVLVTG